MIINIKNLIYIMFYEKLFKIKKLLFLKKLLLWILFMYICLDTV